jgi:hypothetical protein
VIRGPAIRGPLNRCWVDRWGRTVCR